MGFAVNLQRLRPTPGTVVRLLISLVLAVVLWGWVASVQDPESTRTIAGVEISEVGELPEGLQLRTQLPTATVRVTGPESTVEDITADDVEASVDLSEIGGAGEIPLPVRVSTDPEVRERSVSPSRVTVVVEASKTLTVPITPVEPETTDDNLRIGTLAPSVSAVNVSGPASAIEAVDRVEVRIDIGSETSTFTRAFEAVAVRADGTEIPEVAVSPTEIEVTVPIEARGQVVPVLPTIIGFPADGYEQAGQPVINPSTVIIDGPPEAVAQVALVQTAPIDITGATGPVARTVGIEGLPQGVVILTPQSKQLSVIVPVRQRGVTQTLPNQPVTVVNQQPGLSYAVTPQQATVEVVAPQDAIAALTTGSIVIEVDVSGYEPGIFAIAPRVVLPPGIRWTQSNPATIQVTITEGAAPGGGSPVPAEPPAGTPAAP